MTSPLVLINGQPQIDGYNASAGSTISITLANSTGVSVWNVSLLSVDPTSSCITANSITFPISNVTISVTPSFGNPISGFASSGSFYVSGYTITYSGKGTNNFTGCTCSQTGTIAAGSLIQNIVLTNNSSPPPSQVWSFTAGQAGTAVLFQSQINQGLVSGIQNLPATTTTFETFVLTGTGYRIAASGTTLENDPINGWSAILNPLITNSIATPASAGSGLSYNTGVFSVNTDGYTIDVASSGTYNNELQITPSFYSTTATANTLCQRDSAGDGYFTGLGLSGPVTGATNGSFSGQVSAGSLALSGTVTSATGITSSGTITFSGLTANQVVCTNASKQLITLDGYTTAATPNTFVVRDSNGDGYFVDINCSALTASGLVATDANKNLTSSVSGLSPQFTNLTLSNNLYFTATDAGEIMFANGSSGAGNYMTIAGQQSAGSSYAGGAVVIEGGLGGAGTPAEITVGGNTGSIPGSINIVANNVSASSLLATDASKNLTSSVSGLSPTMTGLTLTGTLTVGAGSTITTGTAGTLGITNLSVASGNGNAVTIAGGNTTAAATQSGGALNLSGGTSTSGTGTGGSVVITGGQGSSSGTPAKITVAGDTGATQGQVSIVGAINNGIYTYSSVSAAGAQTDGTGYSVYVLSGTIASTSNFTLTVPLRTGWICLVDCSGVTWTANASIVFGSSSGLTIIIRPGLYPVATFSGATSTATATFNCSTTSSTVVPVLCYCNGTNWYSVGYGG